MHGSGRIHEERSDSGEGLERKRRRSRVPPSKSQTAPSSRLGSLLGPGLLLTRPRIFALGVDVAIDEFDHRHRGVVALPEARLHYARIAALAVLLARVDNAQ